jgi:hypothetical protein
MLLHLKVGDLCQAQDNLCQEKQPSARCQVDLEGHQSDWQASARTSHKYLFNTTAKHNQTIYVGRYLN